MSYIISNAEAVFTNDGKMYTDVRINSGVITELGNNLQAHNGEKKIDAKGCVVYPGFVNTHHHLAQSILKGVPAGLNQALGEWLGSVPYRFWPKIDAQLMYIAAKLGLYELMRSGATTCADHHYLYHAESSPEIEDAIWQAADEMGMRLVLCRGAATIRGSHKGLIQSEIKPESLEQVIDRLESSLNRYHQCHTMPKRQLVVAPTSLIHSSTPQDLRLLAEFARSNGLRMHSHLLEVEFDQQQANSKYQMSALEYAEHVDWLGEDVWFAHLVKANTQALERLAQTKTGIAHCPTSNCRLGSGIAPIIEMEKKGMKISVGVDGSASAESGSMLQELNLAMLLHRSQHGPSATVPEQIIKWGSKNGADTLGLQNVGEIKLGYAADLVLYRIDQPRMASVHSPIYAPLLCGEPASVKASFVQGKCIFDSSKQDLFEHEKWAADIKQAVNTLITRCS